MQAISDNGSRDAASARTALVILLAIFAVNYMDRQILAILIEPIRHDLRLSDTQAALLYGFAFAVFFALLGVPLARLADRSSRTRVIVGSVALFGSMTLICGFVSNYWQLLLTRIGVAAGEAGTAPPSQALIADLYPLQRRTTAMAIFALGPHAGLLLSLAFGGVLAQRYGWRIAFIVAGGFSLIVALVAKLMLREPPCVRRGDDSEASGISTLATELWRHRSVRHIIAGGTVAHIAVSIVMGWTPSLLIRSHGFSIGETGLLLAGILGIGGAAGTVLGGILADRLGQQRPGARLQSVAIGLLIMLPAWSLALGTHDSALALVGLTIGGSLVALHVAPSYAMVQSIAPARSRAVAAALLLLAANLVGASVGPLLIGVISDGLAADHGADSLRLAMFALLPVYLWAAYHYHAAAKGIGQDLDSVVASPLEAAQR